MFVGFESSVCTSSRGVFISASSVYGLVRAPYAIVYGALASNQPRGASRDHLGGRVGRPRDDPRHYRRVGHAQALKTMHAQPGVDNGEFVHTHLAGAHRMSEAARAKPGKLADILGGRLRAGNQFALAYTVKGALVAEFTRGFDGAHDGRKVTIRAEIVAIDQGGILEVAAGQADRPSARRLHQSRRDRECVCRGRAKACSGFGRDHRQLLKNEIDVGIPGGTARQVHLRLDGIAVDRPVRHLAFVFEYDAGHEHMVLQIVANPRQVLDDVDSKFAESLRFPDSREHQELRTADRAGSKNHFLVGTDVLYRAVRFDLDAHTPGSLEVQLHDISLEQQRQVRPRH